MLRRCRSVSTSVTFLHSTNSPTSRSLSQAPCLLGLRTGLLQNVESIFEIETTALAHVACTPFESVSYWLTLPMLIPVSITPGSSLWSRTLDCPPFSVASCEVFTGTASHTWHSREQNEDNSLWPEEYDKVVLRVVSFWQWPLTQSSDGSKSQLSQETWTNWSYCNLLNALTLTISLLHHSLFGV